MRGQDREGRGEAMQQLLGYLSTSPLFLDISPRLGPKFTHNITTTEHHITIISLHLAAVVSPLLAVVLALPVFYPLLVPDSVSSSILSRFHGTVCKSPDLSVFPFPLHVESWNMHHRTTCFYE